jgi:hypothetical protein
VYSRSRNRAHRFVVGLGVQPEAQARCGSARTAGALLGLSFGNDRHLLRKVCFGFHFKLALEKQLTIASHSKFIAEERSEKLF